MLAPLLIGVLTLIVNMAIQVVTVVVMLTFIENHIRAEPDSANPPLVSGILFGVVVVLFGGLLFQIAVWSALFVWLGEFDAFAPAFYHSAVNFATLGYGDIVMSERWRLLGPLEAASGVLMFGLSASTLFTVMSLHFRRRQARQGGSYATNAEENEDP